jgi:cyclophilin family peptidyl-prolyl cis-trans isomerase
VSRWSHTLRSKVARSLFVLAAIALAAPTAGAQQPRGRLSPAERDQYAAILRMTDVRALDTVVVDRALASRSAPVRAAATLSIGQIGRAAAAPRLPRLRTLLQDADTAVAARAAYALGLVQDSASVAALAGALRAGAWIAAEAAWALGQIGEPARAVIVNALARPATSAVRVQLLLAAVKLRPVPIEAVLPHLQDPDPSVVWAAAYAVARPRVPGGMRALLQLEQRPVSSVRHESEYPYALGATAPHRIRAEIARALSRQAAGDSLADSPLAALNRLAADPHPHVRINALRSLATYEGGWRALAAAFDDTDANVRIAAAQSLATATGPVDVEALPLRALSLDTSFAVARAAIAAAMVHDSVPEWTLDWAGSSGWRERAALAAAAANARNRAFAERAVLRLIRDSDARVRVAALSSGLTADTADRSLLLLSETLYALSDPDESVRAAAVAALARDPRQRGHPATMLPVLELALDDVGADARVAAVNFLTAAWRRDSTRFDPTLRAQLAALPPPADPLSQRAAANFPPLATWSRIPIAPRPPAFYRGIVDSIVAPSPDNPPRATIHTERGSITLELFGMDAPLTVHNFISLARRGYYDGLNFHRVVPNFVAQDGDPAGTGSGGPGYSIRDELNPRRYERGALGMALSGPDTGGSQYFITHSPQPHLDGGYTVFGRVVEGFNVLDAIVEGDRIIRVDVR